MKLSVLSTHIAKKRISVLATAFVSVLSLSACVDEGGSVKMLSERGAAQDGVERLVNIGTKDARAYSTIGTDPSAEIAAVEGKAKVSKASITKIYTALDGKPVWSDGKKWTAQATAAHDLLRKSWAHGLQPNSYLPARLSRLKGWNQDSDIALTAGVIKYLSDVRFGRTRASFGKAADILLAGIKQDGQIAAMMAEAEPKDFFYQRTKDAALRSLGARGAKTPNFSALETTMEKLRTEGGPNVSGKKVLVNIAAFDLQAWDDGEIAVGSKIIVGKEGRSTPIGPDRILNLKFSPDWNAPRSIAKKDLYPKLVATPEIFTKFGNEVYLRNKRVIDPTTIDWSQIPVENVRFRQAPGPDNVLGGVRFTLANSNAIYLHDTAHKSLFGKIERASSSGCVRVAKSKELAYWLFQQDGQGSAWPMENIVKQMELGDTQVYHLRDSVPMDMIYYTAWVDRDGALSLSRDLYNKNTGLVAQLALN